MPLLREAQHNTAYLGDHVAHQSGLQLKRPLLAHALRVGGRGVAGAVISPVGVHERRTRGATAAVAAVAAIVRTIVK